MKIRWSRKQRLQEAYRVILEERRPNLENFEHRRRDFGRALEHERFQGLHRGKLIRKSVVSIGLLQPALT